MTQIQKIQPLSNVANPSVGGFAIKGELGDQADFYLKGLEAQNVCLSVMHDRPKVKIQSKGDLEGGVLDLGARNPDGTFVLPAEFFHRDGKPERPVTHAERKKQLVRIARRGPAWLGGLPLDSYLNPGHRHEESFAAPSEVLVNLTPEEAAAIAKQRKAEKEARRAARSKQRAEAREAG